MLLRAARPARLRRDSARGRAATRGKRIELHKDNSVGLMKAPLDCAQSSGPWSGSAVPAAGANLSVGGGLGKNRQRPRSLTPGAADPHTGCEDHRGTEPNLGSYRFTEEEPAEQRCPRQRGELQHPERL